MMRRLLFIVSRCYAGGRHEPGGAVYAGGVSEYALAGALDTMIPWHGLMNLLGFALPGLAAWHLKDGRPHAGRPSDRSRQR